MNTKNMALLGGGVLLLVVAVGLFFLNSSSNTTNVPKSTSDNTDINDSNLPPNINEGEVVGSQKVPAPGFEDVDEIIVVEDADGDAVEEDTLIPVQVEFDVTGTNFEFSVKEMRVKKGDTVLIRFSNEGGFHDWVIDEFNASTPRISEGGEAMVEFVADKAGEFEYYCSVGSHRQLGMVGRLIVE